MHSEKDNRVAIIGGGVGGLAIGCYLQINGYSTIIFEKNSECGGVSFAWKRGGYTFDGATNWLAGSSDSSNMHQLLKELVDFNDLTIIDPDEFITVELSDKSFHVFTDANKLLNEMIRIAPEDSHAILQFTEAIKKAGTFSLPYQKAPELFNIADYLMMLISNIPFILFFSKWKRLSIAEFANKFANPTLRQMFLNIFPHHHHFSVFSVLMTLGWMNIKSGGYPTGGSCRFNEVLVKKYLSLGGKIKTNSNIKEIIIDKKRAAGVKTAEGTIYYADKVVSATDMYHTLNSLLPAHVNFSTKSYNFDSFAVFPSLIQVSLGCKREFTDVSHKYQMPLHSKLRIEHQSSSPEELADMMVRICNFDNTLAPPGCTSIIVHFRTLHYQQWVDLRKNNPVRYRSLKTQIADSVIETLEMRFSNIRDTIEQIDVATPATFIRYTNIFKGSYQGWAPVPERIGKTLHKQIPTIKNFYFAGQWVWPAGGLPGVIRIARQVAQIICHKDKKKFKIAHNRGSFVK